MRPIGTPEQLEKRRLKAVRLVIDKGYSAAEAAASTGVVRRTVQRWVALYRELGEDGLSSIPTLGPAPALNSRDLEKLERVLLKGALRYGFSNDLWTCGRIGKVIEDRFGVSYHSSHIGRILAGMGWSPQKPERRAIERDEAGIKRWVKFEWKKIVKNARRQAPP
jgi:transposase